MWAHCSGVLGNSKGIIHSTNSSDNSWPGDASRAQCTLLILRNIRAGGYRIIISHSPLSLSRTTPRLFQAPPRPEFRTSHWAGCLSKCKHWLYKVAVKNNLPKAPSASGKAIVLCGIPKTSSPRPPLPHSSSSLFKKRFWLHPTAHETLVSQLRMEPVPLDCQESPKFFLIEIYLIYYAVLKCTAKWFNYT